ncbi:hypothetical protein WJX72_001102 [[Myrmecia] bisecta]|uniref:EF-hand domain-containing protein n=1 Tax=[Myrmecia] bisecta TaxID=41462 RepID=A0AAW1PGW6_9CHLO
MPAEDENRRIAREAFMVFEHKEGSKMVDEKEIATVIRSMGINPSNAQIAEVQAQLKEGAEDDFNLIPLETFERVIAEFVQAKRDELARADYHLLMRAFRAFDPDKTGWIDAEVLKNLLLSKGEVFNGQEAGNMLGCAVDGDSGRIYYEDYAYVLATDGRKL